MSCTRGRKYTSNSLQNKRLITEWLSLGWWLLTSPTLSFPVRSVCCLCSHSSLSLSLPVISNEWQKYIMSAISTAGAHAGVMCAFLFVFFFAPMCPCRERYGAADNILFMRADSFCAALCFQPVHERNCNYGTQPPPLTHANMHHNWPIHTGKCLLNGLPISSQQADHYVQMDFLRNCRRRPVRLSHRPAGLQNYYFFFSIIHHQNVGLHIRSIINGAVKESIYTVRAFHFLELVLRV